MSEHLCGVAIMVKASAAGTVKTRLVPPLSDAEAAELNLTCLSDFGTLSACIRMCPPEIALS